MKTRANDLTGVDLRHAVSRLINAPIDHLCDLDQLEQIFEKHKVSVRWDYVRHEWSAFAYSQVFRATQYGVGQTRVLAQLRAIVARYAPGGIEL